MPIIQEEKIKQTLSNSPSCRLTGVFSALAQEKTGGGNPEAVQGRETATPTNTNRSEAGSVRMVGGVTGERGPGEISIS